MLHLPGNLPQTMNKKVIRSVGVILAGGQSSRMHHQDKALLRLGEKRVVDYVVDTLAPQVDQLVINANRHVNEYKDLGIPVLTDSYGPEAGPIAGIYAAMVWAKAQFPMIETLMCCPADVPWFPHNTSTLLFEAMQSKGIAVAWLCTDGQRQPLFSLWPIALLTDVGQALDQGVYSPMALIRSLPNTMVTLAHCPEGYFANLNTPEDLRQAQALLLHKQGLTTKQT